MEPEKLTLSLAEGRFTTSLLKGGSGDPLLYLHGALGPVGGWAPFLDRLANDFTVYAPWFPGYGETKGIDYLEDVTDLALYHMELLDTLGLSSAHIVGHFVGGMVGAEVAALDPHLVDKLVLVSAAGMWLDDAPVADFFGMPPRDLSDAIWADPNSAVAQEAGAREEDDETRAILALERISGLSAVGKFLWPIPDKGLKRRLYRVKAPTLVLWGAQDRIIPPAYASSLQAYLPGSRVETIEDAGHMLMLEQPDEFARRVAAFLKS
jgi:pimeloyl-ACP methyl ester carboxylesterase